MGSDSVAANGGQRHPAILLMGPTAAGKTEAALALADRLPVDLISVDSALVYRGMDIGTAKPAPDLLARYPHALVDILDPAQAYSAGAFARDARREMQAAWQRGRIPLLVGGTMLYFRALREGLAPLPAADPAVRAAIDAEAEEAGWPAMHAELARLDPGSAIRIDANDRQRIQRALEVFRVSGRPLSEILAASAGGVPAAYLGIGLMPPDRAALHAAIERRFDGMLARGFVDEVRGLRERGDLDPALPSMRAVGYRQIWACLEGRLTFEEARYRSIVATRQLAKRQLTWLRADPGLEIRTRHGGDRHGALAAAIEQWLNARSGTRKMGRPPDRQGQGKG